MQEYRDKKADHTLEVHLARDHYLALGVTDLFPFFLLGGRCTSDSSPPPAASLFGLWLSVQRHSGNAVLSHRFRLPRRRSDDTQVAGIDDYFAKVQHCGLKRTYIRNHLKL